MEGIRVRCERARMQRAARELEDARAEFWTKICADINEANKCELDAKRYPSRYGYSGN